MDVRFCILRAICFVSANNLYDAEGIHELELHGGISAEFSEAEITYSLGNLGKITLNNVCYG